MWHVWQRVQVFWGDWCGYALGLMAHRRGKRKSGQGLKTANAWERSRMGVVDVVVCHTEGKHRAKSGYK